MAESTARTAVVALTADLLFASKITGSARVQGVPCLMARDPEDLLVQTRQGSAHLVLVDFSYPAADWKFLLSRLRSLLDPYQGKLIAFTTHVSWKSTRPLHSLCHQVLTQEALVRELLSLLRNASAAEKDFPGQGVEVLELENLRNGLERLSAEIARRVCFRGELYESGLISFQPQAESDPTQIAHTDKEVICHVLSGRGRLRLGRGGGEELIPLKAGTVVRIPPGTAHDFAATESEVMIWYMLIRTTGSR